VFIFLHIPKTAGTSFRFVLENNFGVHHCHTGHTRSAVFSPADLRLALRVFPGLQSLAGHNLVEPLSLPLAGPFYMTFLREPVSRVISHYQDTVIRGGSERSFEESLRENARLQNLMVKSIAGGPDLDKAKRHLERFHFVGLTERFDLSLRMLGRLSPRRLDLNYRRYVIPKDDRLKKALQGESRMLDLAREHNRLDEELYSFAVQEVFPRLCAKIELRPSDRVASYDTYHSAITPKLLACRYYNQFFRQICKARSAWASRRHA
jgi:hypothetical protein